MTGDYSGRSFRTVTTVAYTDVNHPTNSIVHKNKTPQHHDNTHDNTNITTTKITVKHERLTIDCHSVPVHKVLTVNRHDAGGCLTSKGHQLPQRWPARDAVVGVEALAAGAVRIPWVTRCTKRVAVVPAQVVQHRATCAT